jgi:hypothetical protein
MPAEGAGGRKLTELVMREYGACATPGSNDFLVATLIHILHTFEQFRLYEGPFL